jgi:histidine ammonia-lyase
VNKTFNYGQDRLSARVALDLAQGKRSGAFSAETLRRIGASQRAVADIAQGPDAVYGINTGFGPLCTTRISPADTLKLQENILHSHAVGVGAPVPVLIVRLMLVLKLQALAQGYSGIQLTTLERIQWHLKEDVLPVVPAQGSVGASGDLAPLAHLFLPLVGGGYLRYKGREQPAAKVLQQLGIQPIKLGPKEGLALINGTQFMLAYAVALLDRAKKVLDYADLAGAAMVEALLGSEQPFLARVHALRPYAASQHVAARMRALLAGSALVASHQDCERVQDPYSLRCIPQVHGASREAWRHLKEVLAVELNAVTDNPLVFSNKDTVSAGHFHGQPLALPLDYLGLAIAEIGNISDRRIYLSLEGKTTGVPKLLMADTGINSGFMLPQYTTAALVSENKSLCYPASADSIPTSLGQEDHVSMGSISGRKAWLIIGNVEKILAIELLCAAQARGFHRVASSPLLAKLHQRIRQEVPQLTADAFLHEPIQRLIQLVVNGELASAYRLDTDWSDIFDDY